MPQQSYANHARYNPLVHFVLSPLGILILAGALARVSQVGWRAGWLEVAIGAAVIVQNLASRSQALTVQNRVILLEMRLRLAEALPPALATRARGLSRAQLIGLRFASDAELPALVERCLAGELTTAKAVKREVRDWQADTVRA